MSFFYKNIVYERLQDKYLLNKSHSLEQQHNHNSDTKQQNINNVTQEVVCGTNWDEFVGNVSSGKGCKCCEITVK